MTGHSAGHPTHQTHHPDEMSAKMSAEIIIFNESLFDNFKTKHPLTIRLTNLIARTKLTLVQTSKDLIDVILTHLNQGPKVQVVSVYGLVDQFVDTGKQLNYICYLLQKLCDNNVVVNMSDETEEPEIMSKSVVNIEKEEEEPNEEITVKYILQKWIENL